MSRDGQSAAARQDLLEAATEWWLKLREPNVPPSTIAEWMQWCDSRPENKAAFTSVQSLWQKAAAAPLRSVSGAELRRAEWRRTRIAGWLAAAAAVAGVLIFAPWQMQHAGSRIENGLEVATTTGANRELLLPDGTQVVLGGASVLKPQFSAERRTVLLKRGEAFFKVKADREHPFVVVTPSMAVTAVGTAFNVRADDGAVRVTVTEGSVDVGSAAPRTAVGDSGKFNNINKPVRLRAGQQVDWGPQGGESEVAAVDPQIAAAWVSGTLKFRDEPLGSVVAAVNRYSSKTIVMQDEGLAGLHYTGTVVADRIDEWLAALPNSFPVQVSKDSEQQISILPL